MGERKQKQSIWLKTGRKKEVNQRKVIENSLGGVERERRREIRRKRFMAAVRVLGLGEEE